MLINKCADGVPCTEAEHQANRRTEFKIISISSAIPGNHSFNPNAYKAGDKLSLQLFDTNFFNKCLDGKN